jgi:predicted component of type VI protein secretion system
MTSNPTRIAAGALLRREASAGPRLVVRDGPDAGRALALGASQTVGRGRGADLRLSDPAASRLHVRLTRSDGGFALADLRSKNGVLVNGRQCRRSQQLQMGDELAIGASRLTLEPGLVDATEGGGAPAPGTGVPDAGPRSSGWGARALILAAGTLVAAAALLLGLP